MDKYVFTTYMLCLYDKQQSKNGVQMQIPLISDIAYDLISNIVEQCILRNM